MLIYPQQYPLDYAHPIYPRYFFDAKLLYVDEAAQALGRTALQINADIRLDTPGKRTLAFTSSREDLFRIHQTSRNDQIGCVLWLDGLQMTSLLGRLNLRQLDLSTTGHDARTRNIMSLRESKFIDADLDGANFEGAVMHRATFKNCRLYDASFIRADLMNASLTSCDFTRCHFTAANLYGADFKNSNVTMADFSFCNLSGADLRFAAGLTTITTHTYTIVNRDTQLPSNIPEWLQQLKKAAELPNAAYAVWEVDKPAAYDKYGNPVPIPAVSAPTSGPATTPGGPGGGGTPGNPGP